MNQFRKYFNPAQLAAIAGSEPSWGVTVWNVGHNQHHAYQQYPDASHPENYRFNWGHGRVLEEFQLVYIASGSGTFEAEQVGVVNVEPGTVFLLFPGVWHRYKPREEKGWEEYWVGFSGTFADHLMKQDCFNSHAPLIHLGYNTEFLNIFIRLLDTLKYQGLAFSQIASGLTIQLLSLVYASALEKGTQSGRKAQIVNNIRYKIHEQWAADISMEALASQHHVSYIWFRKSFKEIVGISPGQYQLNLKLEKACQMLKETNLQISEVAHASGFPSEFHFSKLFKKKINKSPSAYRETEAIQKREE